MRPPRMTPAPMPCPMEMATRSRTPLPAPKRCSARAMQRVDVSSRVGMPRAASRRSRTFRPSSPLMLGQKMIWPCSWLTSPLTPMPIPRKRSRPCLSTRVAMCRSRVSQAMPRVVSVALSTQVRSSRMTSRRVPKEPMSTQRTRRKPGVMRSTAGLRPPVDSSSPDSSTMPSARSSETNLVTVAGLRPSRSPRSFRELRSSV